MPGDSLGAALGGRAGSRAAGCTAPNSFTSDAPVLMADTSRKPIKNVVVDDTAFVPTPKPRRAGRGGSVR